MYNCNVNIVDAIMGAGKTSAIINHINNSDETEKFLIITPFLDEIERYKKYCGSKNFKTPRNVKANGRRNKLNDLKRMISAGENIVSTHSLFQNFDNELIDLCRAQNYTLVMDEVANVIEEYDLSKPDLDVLKSTYVDIDPNTKQLIWKKEYDNYMGKFDNEKRLCELGSLVSYGDDLMVWLFPVETFNSFRNIYILTYCFKDQLQKYYYDYYGLEYSYYSVTGDSLKTYQLIPYDETLIYKDYDYSKLIHICTSEKLNMIGDRKTDLSFSWYMRNKDNASMKVLKNNIYNFFHNICADKSTGNIWTTFKEYRDVIKGKGYTKGFLSSNARATNEYRDRNSVVYPINKFINPFIKNFFASNNIKVDEDGYALSEMLQFIWRSAIRDGKEIWVYIPSIRMRQLFQRWIEENSPANRE